MPTAPSRLSRRTRRPPRRPSLLVLHLDANRLRRDGLHLDDTSRLTAAVAAIGLDADVSVLDAIDHGAFLRDLGELVRSDRTFDVVVAVGHSNRDHVVMAHETRVDWTAFANYLRPFKPRRLVLIACEAGRWPVARTLFRRLPTLRRIYGAPVLASRSLGELMLALVPYVVAVKAPSDRAVQWAQVAGLVLMGAQVRQWKRPSQRDQGDGELLDWTSDLLDPAVQALPGILRDLFR